MRFIFASALLAAATYAAPDAERVPTMPDMGDFDKFSLYSGYISLNDGKKNMHYMFVEAAENPSTAPVLIWTNGGPGCSSMLGFMQENGPYQIPSGATGPDFKESATSWNREANVLYLDQPAGVGFSTCAGTASCTFNDHVSGQDNLDVILAWFEKYPEFKTNDLYLSGESYGGIYVPYMAYFIDKHNTDNASDDSVFKPNLKGFAVGNGVTNWDYDTTAAYVEMGYWHSLYDTDLYEEFQKNECIFNGPYMTQTTPECMDLLTQFQALTAKVNVYDIFGTCWGEGDAPQAGPELYKTGEDRKMPQWSAYDYTPWAFNNQSNDLPPCTWGNPMIEYLNRDDVRTALHIPNEVKQWDLCTRDITYVIEPKGSQWIYEALKDKYKMLHFSGDTDGAVPTIGTQNWIADMGWDVAENWTQYMVDGQVAGYWESYVGGLTFATVHGAGHMAPQFKPPQTYHLVFNWMFDREI